MIYSMYKYYNVLPLHFAEMHLILIQSDAISDSSFSVVDAGDGAATAVHSSTGSYVTGKMSPYEKLWAEKMQRNCEKLRELGLLG